MTTLHKKIKAARLHRRQTQIETAANAFISLKSYQRIENGIKDPTEEEVNRIAAALGCSADELRHFNLEKNGFPAFLNQETFERLAAENQRLRILVKRLLDQLYNKRGGGAMIDS